MRVLVTGASGFVGNALCSRLIEEEGCWVRGVVRKVVLREFLLKAGCECEVVRDIGLTTDWAKSLHQIDTVVHLAARVHVINDSACDPLAEFRAVNVDGTLNLARQAADAGVRRFVFISTVKVNGEESSPGRPFTETDHPAPQDAYAVSKYEAEQGLLQLASETDMDVVVIRPPLVYGPGVMANFRKMMLWLCKGLPLPLGAIQNKRSLVAIDNLIDLIVTCISHPLAANQIFLVADGEDVSTTELLQRLGKVLRKPARLLPIPSWIVMYVALGMGKQAMAQRLCCSL